MKTQLHNFRSSVETIKKKKVAVCEKASCRKISWKRTGTISARHFNKRTDKKEREEVFKRFLSLWLLNETLLTLCFLTSVQENGQNLSKFFKKSRKWNKIKDQRTRQNVVVMYSTKHKIICGSLKSDLLQKHLQNVIKKWQKCRYFSERNVAFCAVLWDKLLWRPRLEAVHRSPSIKWPNQRK